MNKETLIIEELQRPETIRDKAHQLLSKAKHDELHHFTVDWSQMIPTASYVIEVIKANYPDLNIPYHSRWRHFEIDGCSLVDLRLEALLNLSSVERGKILYELVIISVLLDAGAGANWTYKEPVTGKLYSRSEGLALASLDLYWSGILSADPENPYRVDAEKLMQLSDTDLMKAFQVSSDNPLEGVSGRTQLLQKLGDVIQRNPNLFAGSARLGEFFSFVYSLSIDKTLSINTLFLVVLNTFNSIWPERTSLNGVSLGDVWTHSLLKSETEGSEFIPFHKLSQWLTYSLIEPLEHYGVKVTQLDQLTGLPEYRNGGLFIDTGLLILKNKNELDKSHAPSSELIIEWRGLTIALLDELAILIREQLNCTAETLPLAKILQGGTWSAGRKIAKEKRPSGTPPIHIISDGTLF